MMILSIITVVLSSLIQGVASNFLGYTYHNLSLFSTIYILIALLVIRPHFESEKKYLILLVAFGIIMDIAYTNTFILNACLFAIIYYFSTFFHFFFPYNLFTMNISNLLCIFLYHIMNFLFLTVLRYDNYTIGVLFEVLTHNITMTIIYTSVLYSIIQLLKEKLDLKEVK